MRVALVSTALLAIVTACAAPQTSSGPTAAPKAGQPTPDPVLVNEGQQLVAQKGCAGCHTIPGIPGATGTIGPNLAGVANRPSIAGGAVQNNGPDDLKRWVLDPPAVKPGTAMPKLGLTDDEAARIAAFLETLK